MNKLTEIKEAHKEMKNLRDQYVQADEYYNDVSYLISLLEEKDKALSFYADEKNHDWKLNEYRNVEPTKVMLDGGGIARAALTSSNNEGE
jgi:hypothetical protein